MELALAAPADESAHITAACAAGDAEAGDIAGNAPADADDEGWITAGSLRAQRAAARNGGVAASATVAPPSKAEILFSTDISTAPASPLDLAAATAELLAMGFDSERVEVGVPYACMFQCTRP
jgi:hypothetical protein